MKTVFKKGMKVYDSVSFPDSEGKVVDVEERIDCVRVIVQFDCLDYEIPYTEQGIRASTRKESTPTLSTKPYTLQGFEQKAPVPTYDEIILERGVYVSITKPLILPDEKTAKAFEALAKLIWLVDYYNDGWKPDWKNDDENKYVILTENDEIKCERNYSFKRILSFKSSEIRNKFLEEQRELLKIAKPLL